MGLTEIRTAMKVDLKQDAAKQKGLHVSLLSQAPILPPSKSEIFCTRLKSQTITIDILLGSQ